MGVSITVNKGVNVLGKFIFASRWLQAPLYIGLIIAQGVYVYRFMMELVHLITSVPSLTERSCSWCWG